MLHRILANFDPRVTLERHTDASTRSLSNIYSEYWRKLLIVQMLLNCTRVGAPAINYATKPELSM